MKKNLSGAHVCLFFQLNFNICVVETSTSVFGRCALGCIHLRFTLDRRGACFAQISIVFKSFSRLNLRELLRKAVFCRKCCGGKIAKCCYFISLEYIFQNDNKVMTNTAVFFRKCCLNGAFNYIHISNTFQSSQKVYRFIWPGLGPLKFAGPEVRGPRACGILS